MSLKLHLKLSFFEAWGKLWIFIILGARCKVARLRQLIKEFVNERIGPSGQTEAGSAGEQPARDSQSGCDGYPSGGVNAPPPILLNTSVASPMPQKTQCH